jgi:hypothetical protein
VTAEQPGAFHPGAGTVPGSWARSVSHLGYVVTDLPAAAARWSQDFGVQWAPLERRRRSIRCDGVDMEVDLAVTWSLEGPVRMELLEEIPGTVWERRRGHPVHHVCYWVEDLGAEAERLMGSGWKVEVTEPGPGPVNGFAYLVDSEGFRVEPKPEGGRPAIDRWLSGGSLYD